MERYDYREMPLAQVLDIESGIGYLQDRAVSNTTPFLNDITPKDKQNNPKSDSLSGTDEIIYKKLIQNYNRYTLEIKDKDFDHIETAWKNLPDTLSAFIEVVKLTDKEKIVLHGVSSGAGNLLARFCLGNNRLLKHVKNITSLDQLCHDSFIKSNYFRDF